MIISQHKQGSPEWHLDRAGVITASCFLMVRSKVGMLNEQQQKYVDLVLKEGYSETVAQKMAGYKAAPTSTTIQKALNGEKVGDWSDAAKNYAFRLACERISGESLDDQFETFAMRRGKELEEDCRKRHEQVMGDVVDLAGFVTTDDNKFGCSADAFIDDDGGAEYKCFYAAEKVRPIVIGEDWGDVTDQVQGCLWITGRKYWDQCLYFPALKSVGKDFIRKRVLRDDNYIEALELDLLEFEKLVTEWEEKLRA